MGYLRRFRGKILWAPVGAVVVIGGLVAGTMFASAAAPNLPKKTPAQLLAAMRHAKLPPAMTAVISENANLGFPALPDIAGLPSSALSAASWLAGSHTVQVWYSGPRHVRIAVPVSFGEADLRVNGSQVWLWQSQGQIATHIIAAKPAGQLTPLWRLSHLGFPRPAVCPMLPGRVIKSPGNNGGGFFNVKPGLRVAPFRIARLAPARLHRSSALTSPPTITAVKTITPLQAAQRLLAMIGPTTKVSITGTTVVAGRSAYQLSVEPRSDQSLIGQILIAVDGTSYLPLQVQVIPRGSSSPAFSIGFTTFTPGQPAASNFTFTPPPGAHVHVVKLGGLMGLGGSMGMGGLPGMFPGQLGQKIAPPKVAMPKAVAPKAMPGVRVRTLKLHGALVKIIASKIVASRPISPACLWHLHGLPGMGAAVQQIHRQIVSQGPGPAAPSAGSRVLGSGWLSVVVLPGDPALRLAGLLGNSVPSGAYASRLNLHGNAGQLIALLRTLLNSATRVHGAWGSGRLISTRLVNILITSKGQVLIGAVTPAVLYADAAKVR